MRLPLWPANLCRTCTDNDRAWLEEEEEEEEDGTKGYIITSWCCMVVGGCLSPTTAEVRRLAIGTTRELLLACL